MTAHVHHHKPFPKAMLWAAAAMIVFAIGLSAAGKYAGIGKLENPTAAPRASYELTFADMADGSVAIYDSASGALVTRLEPGTNGFARGVLRGLARDRKLEGIGTQVPFTLANWADGRLTLADPATGREVELNAFGQTQIDTFAGIVAAAAAHAAGQTASRPVGDAAGQPGGKTAGGAQ